jgi:cytochrome d ubiquinol oxidase subunit II
MMPTLLQIIWFVLMVVLLVGYAVLDGYDLGVGLWHLGWKRDEERRASLNAIGPFWDANEVWLITAGGALFAAFPAAYATIFSSFYLALMLVLAGLIFRAVAIEFRSKSPDLASRKRWDVAFALGSIVPALLFGVAIGNLLCGLPLDPIGNYLGTFGALLTPFALLCGLVNLAMVAAHGPLFLATRLMDPQAARARRWAGSMLGLWAAGFVVAIGVAYATLPHLRSNFAAAPLWWLVPTGVLIAIGFSGIFNAQAKSLPAFLASSLAVTLVIVSIGVALYPNLVPASNDTLRSLTIVNASSTDHTLGIMLTVALIGMPLVLLYTAWIHKLFSGRIKPDEFHY